MADYEEEQNYQDDDQQTPTTTRESSDVDVGLWTSESLLLYMTYQWESYQLGSGGDQRFEKELKQLVDYLGHPYPKFFGIPLKAKPGEPPQWDVSTDLRRKLDAPMAPPTRNNSRAQANQMHVEHAKMTDTINILAMERKALRHQHAKKDYLIARLRVKIASLEQLIPIPHHAPRGKSNVTCYECGVTGHYSTSAR
ncbi:hypothetical protein QYE76_063831 [Lolium multiflorum]|uniref:Uncharacterized protein n=1 Tax=Lolium multiflorum TaxID=4521 RepID=A0AAD8S5D1_LOLMU|nr:hypothetical protein QYE76_063831 [Lolium multiflorum]